MKREYIYIAIILIVVGLIAWMIVANRSLRQDIKELKKENKELHTSNKELHEKNKELEKTIASRDERIAESTMIYDSLKTVLIGLNNKSIVTINESYSTVTNLNLDGQILLLSRFIENHDN